MNHKQSSLELFHTTLRRYLIFLRWLIPDSLFRFKQTTFVILISGFMGLAFQAQVFLMIIYYARHFSSGTSIEIFGQVFDPRSSIELLVLASLCVLLSLILSAIMNYFSRSSIIKIARKYAEYCSNRVLHLLSSGLIIDSSIHNDKTISKSLQRVVTTDSRMCSRVLRNLLGMIVPLLTLMAAFVVLIYIDMFLTLFVIAVLMIVLFLQYHLSRIIVGHSMAFEELGPRVSHEYRALIESFKEREHVSTDTEFNDSKVFFSTSSPVYKYQDAYFGRLHTVESSNFVSDIFKAVILGIILFGMGASIIYTGTGWGRLLIYLVALNYITINLRKIFASIIGINRFYPQLRRYFYFIQSFRIQDKYIFPSPEYYEITLANKGLSGSLESLNLEKGALTALVTPLELNRYTVVAMAESIIGDREEILKSILPSLRFATSSQSCPDMSLRKALNLDDTATRDDLKSWFPDDALWTQTRKQIPDDLDKILNANDWKKIQPEIKFLFSLIAIIRSECHFVFLDKNGVRLLPDAIWKKIVEYLKDRIVTLVYCKNISGIGTYGETHVIITDEENILGLGSLEWLRKVHTEVKQLLDNSAKVRTKKIKYSSVDDIDEDF